MRSGGPPPLSHCCVCTSCSPAVQDKPISGNHCVTRKVSTSLQLSAVIVPNWDISGAGCTGSGTTVRGSGSLFLTLTCQVCYLVHLSIISLFLTFAVSFRQCSSFFISHPCLIVIPSLFFIVNLQTILYSLVICAMPTMYLYLGAMRRCASQYQLCS